MSNNRPIVQTVFFLAERWKLVNYEGGPVRSKIENQMKKAVPVKDTAFHFPHQTHFLTFRTRIIRLERTF
jgi:hypothetical protein